MYYKKNKYFFEKINAISVAKEFGTPLYVYSYNKIKKNVINFKNYFKSFNPLVCFSVKSNSNLSILKIIGKFGLGADVVSIGELMKVLKAGIKPNKIVFSGVGKNSKEIEYAIKKKILLINAESAEEIIEIEKIAKKRREIVNIGIRLNPDTDAKTISKISTGKKEDKFGVSEKKLSEIINNYKSSKFIKIKCLSVHIGSQITSNKPYDMMLKVINRVINKIKFKFEYIDLGGGMGIEYEIKQKKLNYKNYCDSIKNFLKKNNSKIIFEPGRSIIGDAGILLTKVIYIKKTRNKNFVILDAAMNDLIRPALYNAKHRINPCDKKGKYEKKLHEFVGPICETSDSFLLTKKYKKLKPGEIMLIHDVGAYGMVLSSNYNLRPKPAEVLINGSKPIIIKKRQNIRDII